MRTVGEHEVHVGIKGQQLSRHLTCVVERHTQTIVNETHHASTLQFDRWLKGHQRTFTYHVANFRDASQRSCRDPVRWTTTRLRPRDIHVATSLAYLA